jgi:hypothetical protein
LYEERIETKVGFRLFLDSELISAMWLREIWNIMEMGKRKHTKKIKRGKLVTKKAKRKRSITSQRKQTFFFSFILLTKRLLTPFPPL